jgi:hypothetical protein
MICYAAVCGAAENVPFAEEWMGPLNVLQAQNAAALRRFFDQVPTTECDSPRTLPLNSPLSVTEAVRALQTKFFTLSSKVKDAVVKVLDTHPLYSQKRYTFTNTLTYSPFLRLQLVLNELGTAPPGADALLTRTLTLNVLFSSFCASSHYAMLLTSVHSSNEKEIQFSLCFNCINETFFNVFRSFLLLSHLSLTLTFTLTLSLLQDYGVFGLIDYLLGPESEENTADVSLGVAMAEVVHRLYDVTQRSDLATVTMSWSVPSSEARSTSSSGSPSNSPRPGATLTSVSANVSPYKEPLSKDPPPPSRLEQLAKSLITVTYFRDPTLTERLVSAIFMKEWHLYSTLNIFVFSGVVSFSLL